MKECRHSIDLPIEVKDDGHEAILSVWWTGIVMKKKFRSLFRALIGSEAQFNLLLILKSIDRPVKQNELAQMLLVDRSNITGLLDRLEKHGNIKRNVIEGDRRSYYITLTPAGRKLIDRIEKQYFLKITEIMKDFSDREVEALSTLTCRLRQSLARIV